MARGIPGYLRYRLINRFDTGNSEVTSDLPHPHQSTWKVVGIQPGMVSSSAVGAFRLPLFPPGTKEFAAYWPSIYSQIRRYQRVEGYLSYSAKTIGLGKLKFAGIITGRRLTDGPNAVHELTGVCDIGLANLAIPFPGELLSSDVDSAILKSYLGTNELGANDAFNPFTAGNYNQVALPGNTNGTWTGTTDDGLTVATCATGSGTALISKAGASANDRWHTQFVEATGRLTPSNDTVNAGKIGVGLSKSNSDMNNSIVGYVLARKSGSRWILDANIVAITAGVAGNILTIASALVNVDDPQGKIPITVGLLATNGGTPSGTNASLTVNGKVVIPNLLTAYDPGTGTNYPCLIYGIPASGTATAFLTNLRQMTRFTPDGPSTASVFAPGTISVSTNSLPWGVDPGPHFLDFWCRVATREGWYLRYTPQPYVVGTRTLGTVDLGADPGIDRTQGSSAGANCIFSKRAGTLVGLSLGDNGDPLSAGTIMTGLSTLDGGGLGYWTDLATMQQIGAIEDRTMGATQADFNSLRNLARRAMAGKVSVDNSGSKTAIVLRDPDTADVYRELDHATFDHPKLGARALGARIMAREFTEALPTEVLTLDQFTWHGEELHL